MPVNQESSEPVVVGGLAATYIAADEVNGHVVENDGRIVLHVKNTGGSSTNVTVKGGEYQGRTLEDQVVAVPATTGDRFIGPFRPALYNQSGVNAGKIKIEFSEDTDVTFAILKVS